LQDDESLDHCSQFHSHPKDGAQLCDKIQGESFTNRYKVTLKDPRDAEDAIELVEKYQN